MITLELGAEKEPIVCPCCGTLCEVFYGFIFKNGDSYAIYHAMYSKSHPEKAVTMAIEFGDWGENATSKDRYTVGMDARFTEQEVQFAFIDPDQSPWGRSSSKGKMLSRNEALAHPNKEEFFHVAEHILSDDTRLANFLKE
jgi:hypothetical protein